MGAIVSIIGLYICGLFSHYFYIWKGKRAKNTMWIVNYGAVVVLAFLLFDILLYTGALDFLRNFINTFSWISGNPFTSGADLWWNGSRVLGISSNILVNSTTEPSLLKEAIMLWITYLPMYLFGKMGSQLLFGRRTFQKGAIWALLPINEPKK